MSRQSAVPTPVPIPVPSLFFSFCVHVIDRPSVAARAWPTAAANRAGSSLFPPLSLFFSFFSFSFFSFLFLLLPFLPSPSSSFLPLALPREELGASPSSSTPAPLSPPGPHRRRPSPPPAAPSAVPPCRLVARAPEQLQQSRAGLAHGAPPLAAVPSHLRLPLGPPVLSPPRRITHHRPPSPHAPPPAPPPLIAVLRAHRPATAPPSSVPHLANKYPSTAVRHPHEPRPPPPVPSPAQQRRRRAPRPPAERRRPPHPLFPVTRRKKKGRFSP